MSTTVHAALNHGTTLDVEPVHDLVNLAWRVNHTTVAVATYKTADLAAALGLVTREEVAKLPVTPEQYNHAINELHAKVSRAHCGKDYWKRKTQETEAERDALRAELEQANAALARVEALLPDMEADIPQDAGNATALHIARKLRAALTPTPPFVLPTEAGAGIMARYKSGDESELRLFASGVWVDQVTGCDWSPERVMREWTGHRLLGADQ